MSEQFVVDGTTFGCCLSVKCF